MTTDLVTVTVGKRPRRDPNQETEFSNAPYVLHMDVDDIIARDGSIKGVRLA